MVSLSPRAALHVSLADLADLRRRRGGDRTEAAPRRSAPARVLTRRRPAAGDEPLRGTQGALPHPADRPDVDCRGVGTPRASDLAALDDLGEVCRRFALARHGADRDRAADRGRSRLAEDARYRWAAVVFL